MLGPVDDNDCPGEGWGPSEGQWPGTPPSLLPCSSVEGVTSDGPVPGLLFNLTCKTKINQAIKLPLLLTQQGSQSFEKDIFFLICDHFLLSLVVLLAVE